MIFENIAKKTKKGHIVFKVQIRIIVIEETGIIATEEL